MRKKMRSDYRKNFEKIACEFLFPICSICNSQIMFFRIVNTLYVKFFTIPYSKSQDLPIPIILEKIRTTAPPIELYALKSNQNLFMLRSN